MKKPLKTIFRVSGGAVLSAALLAGAALLLFFFDKPLVKNIALKYAARKTGLVIQAGKLDYSLFPLSVHIHSIRISQDTPIQSLDIRAEKVEADGDLRKILKGEAPFFETVNLEGGEVRYHLRKLPEVKVDYRKAIGLAARVLESAEKIALRRTNADVDMPGQAIRLEKADLDLAGAGRPNAYALGLSCEKIHWKPKNGNVFLESRLDSDNSLTLDENPRLGGRFRFGSLAFTGGRGGQLFDALIIETDAEWKTLLNTVHLRGLSLDIPGLIKASGSMDIGFAEGLSLAASAEAQVEDAGAVLIRLETWLPRNLKNLQAEGKAKFGGTYRLLRNPQHWDENLEAFLQTERIRLRYGGSRAPLEADVSGRLTAQGPFSGIQVSGTIRSIVCPPAAENFKLRSSQLDLRFQASRNYLRVPSFTAALKGFSFIAGGKWMAFEEVKSTGSAGFDLVRRTAALDRLEVRIPGLPLLVGSAKFDLAARGEKHLALRAGGIRAPDVFRSFSSVLPHPPPGWELDAVCDMQVEAATLRAKPDELGFSTVLRFSEGKFNDPSFEIAGEGLRPYLRVDGEYSIPGGTLVLSGAVKLEQGESLWRDFYISWQKFPVTAAFSGVYDIAAARMDPIDVRFSSPPLGDISVQGAFSLRAPFSLSLGARARVDLGSLQSLFSLAGKAPGRRISLKGFMDGRAQILSGTQVFSIRGDLRLNEASVEDQATMFFLRDIAAEIPVFIMAGDESHAAGESHTGQGYFRAAAFQAGPFITPQPLSLELRGGRNVFHVGPFSLDLFGGRLSFGPASLAFDPQARRFSGLSSLSLDGLDISRIPLNPAQFRLRGEARGDFARVEISPGRIAAQGEGVADIFGGKVIVKDVSIVDPFQKGRAFVLNADLVDLDLKEITDSVPFGEVTGIIRGEIRDLSFSYGQPERFNLRLESVKREGVPQTFSLKAVDNITVISSGEPASLGTGQFWMRFIKGFRYDKIGIVSSLKNDTFTLNGTIKDNGVEYLVKKPGPFGINVINRMPEKKISFKEMARRLKRVGQSGKTESENQRREKR